MQQAGPMGWFHRLEANAGALLAPGTSNPAIWGNRWGAAALTLAGEPVSPIGRSCMVGRHLGYPAPLGKVSTAHMCNTGERGGFCEHGGARDGGLLS